MEISGAIYESCGVQSYYNPTSCGVHLCGQTLCEQPYTALNLLCETPSYAKMLFAAIKAIAECDREESDYVLDLQIDGDCVDNFWTNRQLMTAALNRLNLGNTND